ncbi:helix-turn-helix transcriptional regulator [Nocardioides terrisoli]|uniref:helix-turn-helix transcriptional regulator n=1 Tax=Nocardioides terrisoli TaxID=3388267 RepID=UPI00287BB33D|nr:helix-turn-helix domain-containing protein [Nocardioides marmorisolisilvae]
MGRDEAIAAIGALADPVRRRLYEYVATCDQPVGREPAAEALGIPVHSARFHLDRLVEEGLLEADYQRLSGRSGPGAGRPAKVYRRAAGEVSVSVPARGYDLVGRVFAAAVERSLDGAPLAESLAEEARAVGRSDGAGLGTSRSEDELRRTAQVLGERGYEPTRTGDTLVLHNCPFDALAREHTALVCGVNHDYVSGVIEGLGCCHARAHLDPAEGRCCVLISHEQ